MTHAIELLAQAALMAMIALGAWTAMGDGMILNFVARFADKMPAWIAKPLATCPRCMCSIWGITALLVFGLDVGIDTNLFGPQVTIDALGDFVPVPPVSFHLPRLVEIPALIIAAVGIQEILHRS